MSIPTAAPTRNRWWVVVAAALCVAMGSFDLFGVNVVLPDIADDFGVAPTTAQWVVLSYILPITALALPTGRWLATVGRRSSTVFLVAGFALASLVVGLSPSMGALIAARTVQGVFGAGVFAATTVVAFEAVRVDARGRAIAIIASIAPLGGIAGPSLGALLAGTWGWPWIFFVNLVVGAVAITIFLVAMRPDAGLRLPRGDVLVEVVLLGGATAAVLLALTWVPQYGPGWFALALAAVPLVALWHRTHRGSPLLGLLRSPGVAAAMLSIGFFSAAAISVQYLASYFAQQTLRLTVTETGLALLSLSACTAAVGPLGGYLTDRVSPAIVSAVGFVVIALAIASFAPLDRHWGVVDLAVRAATVGIGQGLVAGPTLTMAMSASPAEHLESAGSSSGFVRNIGFVTGPALMTTIWAIGGYTVGGMGIALCVAAALALAGAVCVASSARSIRRLSHPR